MPTLNTTKFSHAEPKIKYRQITYTGLYGPVTDWEFWIFRKPWLLSWFRKQRWIRAGRTNEFHLGYKMARQMMGKL